MKLLIIRFSSIGDLTQSLSIPSFVKSYVPQAEIHFITRADLAPLLHNHPNVNRLWALEKSLGLTGLLKLITQLRNENYTHIYDAHNNLRSALIRFLILKPKKLVRPMYRLKRLLLIRFHINLFEKPFSGQRDLIKPLEKWGFKFRLPSAPQLFLDQEVRKQAEHILNQHHVTDFITLAPSATYELKRWPIGYWKKLVQLNPDKKFIVLAGPADHFTSELNTEKNVINLTGQTNLLQSAAIIEKSQAAVCNDTGLLHFAEQLGKPAIALMGPAPFGFPSRSSTRILEKELWCRPCSKHGQGPCKNSNFQECLRLISPEDVSRNLNQIL
ncbi:MAG: glycosyltransferase family 9 protein [Bdellovibrio sp.]|nr:glycosyltransferase family 9 protein [Bdellovibrio sp.]